MNRSNIEMIPVFSYWSGKLSWMERLSVASAIETGHDVTVLSYEPKVLAHEIGRPTLGPVRQQLELLFAAAA
jgi:hypothetical protein